MAKLDFDREWLREPNVWDPGSFVLASSQDPPTGAIVLHEAFLNFPSTSAAGMPGIFSCPTECRVLEQPSTLPQKASYDLAIQDISLSAHKIIRYIVSPASDITIIPMNLRSNTYSETHPPNDSANTQETTYLLQSKRGTSTLVTGLRLNVKLDLVLWDFERLTREGGIYGGVARKFQIDGAVLLDPRRRGQFRPSESPVCLLGMDFLMKYPYLLFEPKYDARGEIDFTLARGSLVRRPYTTYTEIDKKLVIHISARHDKKTGKIGCGVFFKSGSILNLFSGVSKYDKDGHKHGEQLWERGILVGIIKALHVVGAFPISCEFTDVIIRTGSPPTNSLLCQMQHTADDFHINPRNHHDNHSLDDRFCCPSPNSDLVMYIYHKFIRKQQGFKIHFGGFSTNENYDAVEAAGILASAGAEMEEFYMEKEDRNMSSHHFSGYSISQFRGHKQKGSSDITMLHQHGGFVGHSIYVNLGLDGYFHIPKARAHAVMEAADKKACLTLSREDAVFTLGYAPWEGEVAAKPKGFLEIKNYEYHPISTHSDLKTLHGILGVDAANKLKYCSKGSPNFIQQTALEIIQGSKRQIKLHEFLSMQTKEYRDKYLRELEQKGLEKGWHFCKDKAWNGYLRRNTRIHDEDGWMSFQDGKRMGHGVFGLTNEKVDVNYCVPVAKIPQGKWQDISGAEPDDGFTEVGKRAERYSQTEGRYPKSLDKIYSEAAVETARSDVKGGSSHNNSLRRHLHSGDCNGDMSNSGYAIRAKNWTNAEELKALDVSKDYINRDVDASTSNTINQAGIGASVASRHIPNQPLSKARYANLQSIGQDKNHETGGSIHSDYMDDEGNIDNHSSKQWSDSEDLADSNVHPSGKSWPGTKNTADSYDSDPGSEFTGVNKHLANPNSIDNPQKWKPKFSGTKPMGVGVFPVAEFCNSGLCTHRECPRFPVSPFEIAIGPGRKGAENPLPPHVPRKSIDPPRDIEKSNPSTEWTKNKWPSFDWMLENFKEDSTALP